jgi:hypothetical protein
MYWSNEHNNIVNTLLNKLMRNELKIRRKSINGYYILYYIDDFTDKYIEFKGDKRGKLIPINIKKRIKTLLIGGTMITSIYIDLTGKEYRRYKKLLNDYDFDNELNIPTIKTKKHKL